MKIRPVWCVYCALLAVCCLANIVSVTAEVDPSPDDKNTYVNKESEQKHDTTGQIMLKKCLRSFSAGCLKLAVVKLLDRLPSQYKVYPGISLVRNATKPTDVDSSKLLKLGTSQAVNVYALQKLKSFLYSFNVKVELEDPELLKRVKNLTEDVVDALVPQPATESGRSKKGGGGGGGGHAMMWSACTLAAVGFSIMAAVAGKALMASVLALMLAMLSAFKGHGHGGGGGHKTAHLEIIAKPHHVAHYQATGPSYVDHDHYHSSYTAPAYEYARTIPAVDRMRPGQTPGTMSLTDAEPEESHQLAYRGQYKDMATTYRPHHGQT